MAIRINRAVSKLTKEKLSNVNDRTTNANVQKDVNTVLTFDRNLHYTVGDGDSTLEWRSRKDTDKLTVKWGQLKLLTTEMQFFTLYWDPVKHLNPTCIYVGAASGVHINLLSDLFPMIEFHLYDPREFDKNLYSRESVKIHQQFFTDKDAEYWKNQTDKTIFFICDIRSSEYKRLDEDVDLELKKNNERIPWNNMLMQQEWVKIVNPEYAHLKFRLPYCYPWVLDEGTSREYLSGIIYRQPWAGQTSTETRLIVKKAVNGQHEMRHYDLKAYEGMLFYHNTVVREKIFVTKPFTNKDNDTEYISHEIGLTNDYDSVAFMNIIKDYVKKSGGVLSSAGLVSFAKEIINRVHYGMHTLVEMRSKA